MKTLLLIMATLNVVCVGILIHEIYIEKANMLAFIAIPINIYAVIICTILGLRYEK